MLDIQLNKEEFEMNLNRFCELNHITRRTALNWIKAGRLKCPNKILQGKRIDTVIVSRDMITSACLTRKYIPCERTKIENLIVKVDKKLNVLKEFKEDLVDLLGKELLNTTKNKKIMKKVEELCN